MWSKRGAYASLSINLAVIVALNCEGLSQTPDAAQSYPRQTVRIVVPFAAGSVTDVLARIVADRAAERWKQPVIVENRPGIAGAASVAKSTPDGHTMLLTSNGHTIIGALNKNLPFDPIKDFSGVTQVASVPVVLIVTPTLPAGTLNLIALARAKPDTLNFASAGLASAGYIAGELFKQTARIKIVHVPHKGAPEALTSTIRGDSQMNFIPLNVALGVIGAGKVRALAIASPTRVAALPDVPTFAEAGLPEFEYDAWFGLLVAANTPRTVVIKINQDVASILEMPDVKKRLSDQGGRAVFNTPERFEEMLKADSARFGALLKEAGIGSN